MNEHAQSHDPGPTNPGSTNPGPTNPDDYAGFEIAIVGMAGRFPGAGNADELWRNLRGGVESIRFVSPEELEESGVDPEIARSPNYIGAAPMIGGIDLFDASFFGFSPREAEIVDPQSRLLLECAWEALEDAGCDPERFGGPVGVYAGARISGYLMNLYSRPDVVARTGDFTLQVGGDKDYVATRISYKLDLHGPSFTVQTACSTALVAVHLACQGLLAGECDMALAGAVGIRFPEAYGYPYVPGEVYSPDGHCRTFDAKAGGTVFGSGMGLVVLKRLGDAVAAGDRIRAVIRGSAINNDGAAKVGYTAPGSWGQTEVVRSALAAAAVDARSISYVEAHGTATQLGDPIEVNSLAQVYREHTADTGYCAIGSVKTNIGHAGPAAGISGLMKTVLALEHEEIPPSLHYETPNPQIDFANSPFFVNTSLRPWKSNGAPRRAGVSSFGIGGTNAHIILEEAPPPPPSGPSREAQLLLVSARTESALETARARLATHLENQPDLALADVAHSLRVGRKAFEQRAALVARSREEAIAALRAGDSASVRRARAETKKRPVAFLFSGQGAQYPGMGAALYEGEPAFRAELDRCAEILRPRLGLDLRQVLFPADATAPEAHERLAATSLTQPALLSLELALAALWAEWGVVPQAMLGHSIGEYAAACLAGVMSREDALALVAERGRLMQSLPAGSMLSVALPEAELMTLLESQGGLSLAAINAPGRSVVSGPHEAVAALERHLTERQVPARRLHTSHAFHSAMMEPILEPFLAAVSRVELRAPRIPFVSNLTGTWISEAEATDPAYWVRHLRGAVRFADGVAELCADGVLGLLEIGPGNTLASFARQHPARKGAQPVAISLPHAKDSDDALGTLLDNAGRLWLEGVELDWRGFSRHEQRRLVELPTYAFERRRYWIEAGAMGSATQTARRSKDLADWFYLPYWQPSLPLEVTAAQLAEATEPWLIFADELGFGAAAAALLRRHGRDVIEVRRGEHFAGEGERFTVRPAERADYDALLGTLARENRAPGFLLHAWLVDPLPEQGELDGGLDGDQELAFFAPLALAQALGKSAGGKPIRLALVSAAMQRTAGDREVEPAKALALGPALVMPQEYPNLTVKSVDLAACELGRGELAPGDLTTGELELTVRQVLGELLAPAASPVVALRNGERLVRQWSPARLPAAGPAEENRALRLRSGGVYLLTGGLGGFGLRFAAMLAREHGARLVLLGRGGLPPREEWPRLLATLPEHDALARRLRAVGALEADGAEVMVIAADVADQAAVAAAVAAARARFGRIDGVIHAAGVAGGGLMQLKTAEAARRVLAPKVAGTRALARALAGEPLDFFLLCSSNIAILGGFGQVDYCAANNFLDAFAEAAAAAGDRAVMSVNWAAWRDVGMAAETAAPTSLVGNRDEAAPSSLHPLLDRCIESTAERAVYLVELSPERHWVLDEHRILGTPTVPGTTYLEMASAALAHHLGAGPVEIRDLLFLTPLQVAEGGVKQARLTLEREGDGYRFRVESDASDGQAAGERWQEHVQGRIARLTEGPPPPLDPAALLLRTQERHIELEGGVMTGAESFVQWGPRWQSLTTIDLGKGEALAALELPESFRHELAALTLHPALLDVATALGSGMIESDNYLPLSYRRVRVHRPLPAVFYSFLARQDAALDDRAAKETVSLDLSLLAPNGEILVAIEGFAMKRVGKARRRFADDAAAEPAGTPAGSAASTSPRAAAPEAAPAAKPAVSTQGLYAASGMAPDEGVEALRRLLGVRARARFSVSPRDLAVLIERARASNRASLGDELDRAAAPPQESHPRPNLGIAYAPPTNDVERGLAEIWQEVLGLAEVGIHDNFFDLGGDSVLGIRVVARARDKGWTLAPEQLFEHQTVAELAGTLGAAPADPAGEPASDAAEEVPAFAEAGLDETQLEKVLAQLGG